MDIKTIKQVLFLERITVGDNPLVKYVNGIHVVDVDLSGYTTLEVGGDTIKVPSSNCCFYVFPEPPVAPVVKKKATLTKKK